ncbi:Serine/threonine-protein kinase MRCK beta [Apophysomyces sp. BC1034]|nr:Serine/threonine-protein kinase MRCK beta [Apophysomyces sp. BC1021]KAG0188545.1 Serine/threonine-protein kinase MRCK beta [Apophysomyces sp. BC1034]
MTFATQCNSNDTLTHTQSISDRLAPLLRAFNDDPNYADAALDALMALYYDCSELKNIEHMTHFLHRYTPLCRQINATRVNKNDFDILKPLAKGQFGTVSVVRSKLDSQIYAMKVLNKDTLLSQHERAFSIEERLVLSQSSEWMPSLYAAFQDGENLYLVMEYAGGGDLFSVLERQENQCLTEDEARFYIAEMILAVDHLHHLGYVHRDIKPQNILIDATGHIKLTDFGSCIRIESCSKIPPTTVVGTCDYVSPEVLQAEEGKITYGTEVDWWSIGVVLYEMLQGDPPFYDENETTTCLNILTHNANTPNFKFEEHVSKEAKDLICNEETSDLPVSSRDVTYKPSEGRNLPFIGYTYFTNAPIVDKPAGDRLRALVLRPNNMIKEDTVISNTPPASRETSITDLDLQDKVDQLQKVKEDLAHTATILRKDVESMQRTIDQLQKEHTKTAKLEAKIDELRQDNVKLKTEIARFEEAERRDTESIQRLERENAELTMRLARLRGEASETKFQLATWKDLVDTGREERRELQQRLKKTEDIMQVLATRQETTEANSEDSLVPSQASLENQTHTGCSPIQLSMWKRDRELLRRARAELSRTEEKLFRTRQENAKIQKELSEFWLKAFDNNGTAPIKNNVDTKGKEDEL